MRNAFYTNTLTLLHSPTPLTFPLLYNKNIIVNLYKLYFPSSLFSLNQTKRFSTLSLFHPSNQTHMRENQIFSILPLFYPPTNFSSSHFSTPPTKRTLKLLYKQRFLTFRDKLTWFLHIFFYWEFHLMVSAPDDSSLSSNQDTNQFFV